MSADKAFQFLNGYFEWNEIVNELQFVSQETATVEHKAPKPAAQYEIYVDKYEIVFKDDIDLMDKIMFRKKYRRKADLTEPKVILLQDVKDVVLFTASTKKLSREFIKFIHTPKVDRLLRAFIIYFQFYFQTWNFIQQREMEKKRKISKSTTSSMEDTYRDDLADLRCMVAREYLSLLIYADDKESYYKRRERLNSLIESDRRSFEILIQISERVVWYALNKPALSTIETEISRLVRSDYFYKVKEKSGHGDLNESEKNVLRGKTDFIQKRLYSQTPVGKEYLYGVHDHRMLAIGQTDFPPDDERLRFLEKAYLLPEENLMANGIQIGILGMPRDKFDVMLKPRRKAKRGEENEEENVIQDFVIPSAVEHSFDTIPWKYPTAPSRIKVIERKQLLKRQCAMWIKHLETCHVESTAKDFTIGSCGSMFI